MKRLAIVFSLLFLGVIVLAQDTGNRPVQWCYELDAQMIHQNFNTNWEYRPAENVLVVDDTTRAITGDTRFYINDSAIGFAGLTYFQLNIVGTIMPTRTTLLPNDAIFRAVVLNNTYLQTLTNEDGASPKSYTFIMQGDDYRTGAGIAIEYDHNPNEQIYVRTMKIEGWGEAPFPSWEGGCTEFVPEATWTLPPTPTAIPLQPTSTPTTTQTPTQTPEAPVCNETWNFLTEDGPFHDSIIYGSRTPGTGYVAEFYNNGSTDVYQFYVDWTLLQPVLLSEWALNFNFDHDEAGLTITAYSFNFYSGATLVHNINKNYNQVTVDPHNVNVSWLPAGGAMIDRITLSIRPSLGPSAGNGSVEVISMTLNSQLCSLGTPTPGPSTTPTQLPSATPTATATPDDAQATGTAVMQLTLSGPTATPLTCNYDTFLDFTVSQNGFAVNSHGTWVAGSGYQSITSNGLQSLRIFATDATLSILDNYVNYINFHVSYPDGANANATTGVNRYRVEGSGMIAGNFDFPDGYPTSYTRTYDKTVNANISSVYVYSTADTGTAYYITGATISVLGQSAGCPTPTPDLTSTIEATSTLPATSTIEAPSTLPASSTPDGSGGENPMGNLDDAIGNLPGIGDAINDALAGAGDALNDANNGLGMARDMADAWRNAPAIPPPMMPSCSTKPLENEICALWYILENTLLSGIGMIYIPIIVLMIDLMIVIRIIVMAVIGIKAVKDWISE